MQARAQNVPLTLDAYLIASGELAQRQALVLAEKWRDALPNLRLMVHHGGGSFKNQFKKADKSDAPLALILGDDEIKNQQVGVKFLREDTEQVMLAWAELPAWLAKKLSM
jgi:histidyl-tRNA synthetase